MTGYFRNEFNKVAAKAINNYAKAYGEKQEDVSILMRLDGNEKDMQFWTMIKNIAKEGVKFLHIYHGPKAKLDITGQTYFIPRGISKAIRRLAGQHGISKRLISVVAKWDEGEVYLFLMNGNEMVMILGDDDMLTDEQVAIDQMEE